MPDYQVIIVGGGPVGLTLAIDLGQRGIRCLLIEKRSEPSILPKMERCHPRTMEHFRRLGVSQKLRAIGYPEDDPLDAFLVTSLDEPAIAHMPRPSAKQSRNAAQIANDGRAAGEPHLIISQYALEPVLKTEAERTPGVTVSFGTECLGFKEYEDYVELYLRNAQGDEYTQTSAYVAGCDGANSPLRHALGFKLEGHANLREQTQALFRCAGLFEQIKMGKGAHYYLADDRWTFLITQSDTTQFAMHAMVDDPSDMPALFERFVGFPIEYETLFLGTWTMRLMLADHYASARIYLAGDAVHLVTPIGGLGMNTGIGDVIDLAWKLEAAVKLWAGPELLSSYEIERRQIGVRNMAAAESAYLGRQSWREACDADLNDLRPTPANEALRHELGDLWKAEHKKATQLSGIILGYRYLNSPLIAYDPDDNGNDQKSNDYFPSTKPGLRLPALWLSDGSLLQDSLGKSYALVATQAPDAASFDLLTGFEDRGINIKLVDLHRSEPARKLYGDGYILIRPDQHICWRGQRLPEERAALVALATGHFEDHRSKSPFHSNQMNEALL